ncbi:DUF397 domain-containing protein [Streptomyces galilaeus]
MTEPAWFKSSYSDSGGGDCVEVALPWRRSTYSDSGGGECVEVATTSAIHIRDSKTTPNTPDTPHLTVTPTTWTAFLSAVRA